jgi:uncharacterized membrane protein YdbT with pleckstrin-like domain
LKKIRVFNSDEFASNKNWSRQLPNLHEMEDTLELELPDDGPSRDFRSHWQLFIPTLIILISYALCLLYLWATNRTDTALFRLAALVAGVGVPLLAAHAFLRYETVRVRLGQKAVKLHPGWPKNRGIEIPNELIMAMKVKRGLFGRLMGGGTLIIATSEGTRTAIPDLKEPEKIIEMFETNRTADNAAFD